MSKINVNRRRFLKVTGSSVFGTGLILAMKWDELPAKGFFNKSASFQASAWLKIGTQDNITMYVVESEMGQGSVSLMSMILAEELEIACSDIQIERAPLKPLYGYQATGGSSSIRKGWATLRTAGAITREILISTAAEHWSTSADDCFADNGFIIHKGSGKKIRFSELASKASSLPIPEKVTLKSPQQYKILGTAIPRQDIPVKINGSAEFGIDVQLPNMLYATTVHCPFIGGKVKKVDDSRARSVPGVQHILSIDNAVAVVAVDTWVAMKAANLLDIEWHQSTNQHLSSKTIRDDLQRAASHSGKTAFQRGDISNTLSAAQKLSATYETPFQAHAAMEPMNCTAQIKDGYCEVWAPTQSPSKAKDTAAQYGLSKMDFYVDKVSRRFGLAEREVVDIHTTFLGGGFGRRLKQDFVAEAVQIAKKIDQPVKLTWSREQDIQHDFYHPYTFHMLEGSIDSKGKPLSWWHRLSSLRSAGTTDLPYAIPNIKIEVAAPVDSPVPTGPWRSVSHHYYAFAKETFFDELAHLGKQDPLELRLELLQEQRLKAVLELAADKSGWGRSLPEGHFIGLAAHRSFGSYVAQAVEISLGDNARIHVHRVVVAIDCGIVINPDIVRAQMEGSVVFGLTAALKTFISIEQGQIQQSNFHDFAILQFDEMPKVDTYIVNSNESPQGIGEPGVPPLAPALANAVFAATQVPVRSLPFSYTKQS
ncbi:MAG: molybdopterin-dependent oxidoreductase [Gammaproteobacteria bacterium]|nr:molybdopterin-dependent oxidoreductase [Gammaproteobacteria bacterium]